MTVLGSAQERKRIRAAVIAQLAAKNIGALSSRDVIPSTRIFDSRVYPVSAEQCPAINVFCLSHDGKNENQVAAVPTFDYDLHLRTDLVVTAIDDWANIADDYAEEIAQAIMADADFLATLGLSYFAWHNTSIQASGDGDQPTATVMIDFGMSFGWNYPVTITDAFETMETKLDAIDPADPNTGHASDPGGYAGGSPGPDGRAEANIEIKPEQ